MARLTKDKVKAMLEVDFLPIPCDNASELDSVYQTAIQAKGEMGERGKSIAISKSNVTMTVVVRTGIRQGA